MAHQSNSLIVLYSSLLRFLSIITNIDSVHTSEGLPSANNKRVMLTYCMVRRPWWPCDQDVQVALTRLVDSGLPCQLESHLRWVTSASARYASVHDSFWSVLSATYNHYLHSQLSVHLHMNMTNSHMWIHELKYNFKKGGTVKVPGSLPFVDGPVFLRWPPRFAFGPSLWS